MPFSREQLKPPAELSEDSVSGSWASPLPYLLAEAPLLLLGISRQRGLRSSKCQSQPGDTGPVSYSATAFSPGLVKDIHNGTDRKSLTLSTQDSWHTEECCPPLSDEEAQRKSLHEHHLIQTIREGARSQHHLCTKSLCVQSPSASCHASSVHIC